MKLPVPSDARRLRGRLAREERGLVERLAVLEARVRRFADVERPAYESWRRLEFGPLLATLQELSDELRMRSVLAERLSALVELHGLHPREALHRVTHPEEGPARRAGDAFDPDEVEARRRAKLERKRARRKDARRARRAMDRSEEPRASVATRAAAWPTRVVDLYRALARRLHPDSPSALRTLEPARLGTLWTDVQDAYEAGSLDRLLAISAWIETLGERAAGGGVRPPHGAAPGAIERDGLLSFSERYERLRGLRRAHRALERTLTGMRSDPAWAFEEQRTGARRKLARQARAAIDDEIARLRRALQELDEFFAAIGPPRRPGRKQRR